MPNTFIPSVSLNTIDGQLGAAVGSGAGLQVVAGCCEKGPILTLKQHSNVDALFAEFGYGPATEYAALYIEKTGNPVLFCRLTGSVAGANTTLDIDEVTGTSVVTLTGTPLDTYDGLFEVITGGTIATAGIVFRYSLDGGVTYAPNTALGTAASYVIPGTGLTLNFAAGTLVAGDSCSWGSSEPDWAAGELDDLFDKLEASTQLWRSLHLVGESAKTDLDTLGSELATYETGVKRYGFAFTGAKKPLRDVRMIGNPNLTFAAAGQTITRSAGSFVTEGWSTRHTLTVAGSASNNATFTIVTVAATILTVSSGAVNEGPSPDISLTGVESKSTYQSTIRTEYDAYGPAKTRIATGAAGTRIPSQLLATRFKLRRSQGWAAAVRFGQFGPHESLGKVKNGSIDFCDLRDSNGNLVQWDSRLDSGLSSKDGSNGRYITLQSHDGRPGAFICLPSMMHDPGSDFRRVHLRAVLDIACEIAQQTLTTELQDDLVLNPTTGFVLEAEAKDIEKSVRQRLEVGLLSKGYATDAFLTLSRNDNIAGGGDLTGKLTVIPLGYTEGIAVDVAFSNPAAAAA